MPIKIQDIKVPQACQSREHNPPTHQVFEPGVYEHTCPDCKKKQQFVVLEDA